MLTSLALALLPLLSSAGTIHCAYDCTKTMHDCVKNDGGQTRVYMNCELNYGLCMNTCRDSEEETSDSAELESSAPVLKSAPCWIIDAACDTILVGGASRPKPGVSPEAWPLLGPARR